MSQTQNTSTPKKNPFNISINELSKLKSLFDYIFYDQTKYYASYSRFIECFNFINPKFFETSLLNIFKEICGHNKKYITIARFINKYLEYKQRKKTVSLPLKKFFSFLFSSFIKSPTSHAGVQTNEKTYSSTLWELERLSKLTLLKSSSSHLTSTIQGILLEYNDIYNTNLYIENSPLSYNKAFELKLEYLKDLKVYDGITHVFGTYSNKVNFIGFKCRGGKMVSFGSAIGEPFLFGVYGCEVSALVIQLAIGKGLMMIQPHFKECAISNIAIDQLNDSEIFEPLSDVLIFEEKYYDDNSKKMNDDVIYVNIVKDYCNVCNVNEMEINRNISGEIVFKRSEIKKEADKLYKEYLSKINSNNSNKNENEKNVNIKINKWTGSAISMTSVKDIINSKDNYDKIIERLKFEIEREIHKEYLKYEYDNNFNFYDDYLKKYELLDPFPLSPKRFNNYSDVKEIELEFNNFNNQKEKEEESQYQRKNNILYTIKDPNKSYSDAKIFKHWLFFSKHLIQLNFTSLVIALISLQKAMKVIESTEKNFFDNNTNLKKKIQIYKSLYKSKRVVTYILNKGKKKYIPIKGVIVDSTDDINENNEQDNLNEINNKINAIENFIEDSPNLYPQLSLLYSKYKKKRLLLINDLNKQQEEKVIQSLKEQFSLDKVENDIKKQQKKLNINKYNNNNNTNDKGELIIQSFEKIKIPNDIIIYKNQQIPTKGEFNDLIFPRKNNTINIPNKSNIKWEKADMILYTNNYNVIKSINTLNFNTPNLLNGINTNYYLLSAIHSLLKYPSIIYSLFPLTSKSSNGLYGVYLRLNGIKKLILLDSYFPCIQIAKKEKYFAFSSIRENIHNSIWINLIEKAWAKVNGSYNNILNGAVNEIYDVLTNASTEIVIVSHIEKDFVLNKMINAIGNKFILSAKANINSSYDIGLIPDNNYIIDSVKKVNIGAIDEHLIKMKNAFGCLKYSGNWSRNNYKWIPSLKKEINNNNNNEDDFFISIGDFVNYFSLLYICKVYTSENNEQSYYKYIHYSKSEIEKPNIAILKNKNEGKTKIYIQLYQKNLRFIKNNSPIIIVPGFILIIDKKNKYITSISSSDQTFNIEIELSKGEYYIVSDIMYRYITKVNLHGYNLSTYSNRSFELLKNSDNSINAIELLNSAVINYAKKNLDCKQGDFGIKIYENKKAISQFPFIFNVYENTGEFENELFVNIIKNYDRVKNFAFYLNNEELNEGKEVEFVKDIHPKQSEVVFILRLKENVNFNINYEIEPKLTDEQLEKYIKLNGNREQLDEEEMIIQYMIEYKKGYCVLIENKYEDEEYKMKLILNGLIYEPKPNGIIYFKLGKLQTKMFKLKVDDNNTYGIVSFNFQFA